VTPPPFKAYFDRSTKTIEGRFSILHSDGRYVIEKARVRSGQKGWTHSSWTRGKSPIPFGVFNLYTKPTNVGQVAGAKGVGEFFPVDNQGDRRTIRHPDYGNRYARFDIGLHEENALQGSAGCIVVVDHLEWIFIRDWLKSISIQLEWIPLEVL
jgi:hypothetical protein